MTPHPGVGMVCAKTQKGQVSGAGGMGSNILNKESTKERWEKGGRASWWGLSVPTYVGRIHL